MNFLFYVIFTPIFITTMMRVYITVGSVDVSTVDPETLLSCFSIVFQDVTFFNNTVMENIRVDKKDATGDEVLAAARLANCDEFVKSLPNGYNTVIGENGSELFGWRASAHFDLEGVSQGRSDYSARRGDRLPRCGK